MSKWPDVLGWDLNVNSSNYVQFNLNKEPKEMDDETCYNILSQYNNDENYELAYDELKYFMHKNGWMTYGDAADILEYHMGCLDSVLLIATMLKICNGDNEN